MVQILGFWSSIEFGIINGIYSLVIKVYNIMEKILEQDVMDMSKFENIATTMYVLAGVFILFKVVIAMVQMILNPDLVTDKQAGAGKLITRIVTCLVMLIAFSPNGFIFGYEGLFSRIEKAVIAPDGLINNIINADLSTADKKETEISNQSYNNNSNGGFFIENVYAATNINCYYYRISSSEYNTEDADAHGNERYKIKVDKIYKISYYYNPSKTTISTEGLTKAGNSTNVYYKERSGVIGGSANCTTGNCQEYNHLGYRIQMKDYLVRDIEKKIKNGKCPGSLTWNKNDKKWQAEIGGANSLSTGLRGGTSSLKELENKIKTLSTSVAGFDSGGNSFVDKSNGRSKPTGDDYLFFTPVSENAVAFGQATASSLQECTPSAQSDCIKYQKDMFETKSANKEIVNLIDDENLEVSFIFSIITGIGLIIYLLFLCVEIIIRRLKLFFLEVLAPIPIISYVDPKDKTFNTWFKMYISTYLDLFIKLIAIKIAIDLVAAISNEFWSTGNIDTGIIGGTLIKFFYIVAILAFAKILPTMISKIFNLDSMGGSFKDIMGMAKGVTRAGMGAAGAALGAGAGVLAMGAGIAAARKNGWKGMLGAGAQGLGNIASGAIRGAGSGWNRNITGGASNVLATGRRQRDARADGSTLKGRIASSLLKRGGFSDPYEKAVALRDINQEYANTAKAYEDESLNKVNKAIGNGFGSKFASLVEARNDAAAVARGDKVSKYRKVDNGDGTVSYINKLNSKDTVTFGKDDISKTEEYEKQLLNSAEANARINGEEKAAAKEMRKVFATGTAKELKEYGFELGDDDFKEMAGLKSDADEAARNAGYNDGYSGETKNKAKQDAKKHSADARKYKADHDAINRSSN